VTGGGIILRDADAHDLPAILEIHNHAVLNETSIWNDDVADLRERRAWLEARHARGFPVYVAELDGMLAGYGTFGDFRPHQGYRFTVEHSIYVAASARRRGIGSALLQYLIDEARRTQKRAMIGGIASDNAPSLALHARFGFAETGRMPQVGFKFGRWLDLVLMQKLLV
jgi:L-amino acid N-acyltransferase